jgi:hypothetical protein
MNASLTMKKFLKNKLGIFIVFAFLSSFTFANALTLTPIRLEVKADPGQTITKQFALINEHDKAETYYSSYANFEAQGDSGNPEFVDPKEGLGTWMKAPASITLSPGESKLVSFTVSVPKDARAGGYFAALFWGTQPPAATSTSVSIGAKTGLLVLLSVNGNVKESGGIQDYNTKSGAHYYEALPVEFSYHFQNSGGDRIKPDGNIVVRNMFGFKTKLVPANVSAGNVLPSQTRYFETTWAGSAKEAQEVHGFFNKALYEWHNFAFGRYTATLDLTYGLNGDKASASTVVWVFPWQFLILFILILIIAIYIIEKGLKLYNNWLIGKAEERIEEEEASGHHHEHHRPSI